MDSCSKCHNVMNAIKLRRVAFLISSASSLAVITIYFPCLLSRRSRALVRTMMFLVGRSFGPRACAEHLWTRHRGWWCLPKCDRRFASTVTFSPRVAPQLSRVSVMPVAVGAVEVGPRDRSVPDDASSTCKKIKYQIKYISHQIPPQTPIYLLDLCFTYPIFNNTSPTTLPKPLSFMFYPIPNTRYTILLARTG